MLAHSLLSRNKSDCQTDYKLRNFGNRNYLHAAAKIQLFIVGVKISKMQKSMKDLFGKFSLENDKLSILKAGAGCSSVATGDTCSDHGNGCYADDCDQEKVPLIVIKG